MFWIVKDNHGPYELKTNFLEQPDVWRFEVEQTKHVSL